MNSNSSGVGLAGKNIPGIKKSIQYQRIATADPIIRRFAPLTLSFLLTKIKLIKSKIKEIRMIILGKYGSRK